MVYGGNKQSPAEEQTCLYVQIPMGHLVFPHSDLKRQCYGFATWHHRAIKTKGKGEKNSGDELQNKLAFQRPNKGRRISSISRGKMENSKDALYNPFCW